ncbi:hypothetical protein Q5M85_00830 [Paraclostridium bifermentans]|nr:hypothetical protein [Paraclostridium bifermentans]
MVGRAFEEVNKEDNISFINHEFDKMVSMLGVRTPIVNTTVGIVAAAWIICTVLLIFFRKKLPKKN